MNRLSRALYVAKWPVINVEEGFSSAHWHCMCIFVTFGQKELIFKMQDKTIEGTVELSPWFPYC